MTTSGSIPPTNVCASTLNFKRQSIEARRRSSSVASFARKSTIRENLHRLRRFIVGGTVNLRKNRFHPASNDSEAFENDANIMALSCTAADEEIVPLSPNRAERIVCKNSLDVDHSTHPAHNDYLEQRAELLKGTPNENRTTLFHQS